MSSESSSLSHSAPYCKYKLSSGGIGSSSGVGGIVEGVFGLLCAWLISPGGVSVDVALLGCSEIGWEVLVCARLSAGVEEEFNGCGG